MNPQLLKKVMTLEMMDKTKFSLVVCGSSMLPTIKEGDIIDVTLFKKYYVGDVVAFFYNNKLLVHRIVKYVNELLYCKGDNSFRIEKVSYSDVVGKVVSINGLPIKPLSNQITSLSYIVYREFCKTGKNVNKTMQSGVYMFYNDIINNRISNNLIYQRNKRLIYDFIYMRHVSIKSDSDDIIISLDNEKAFIINLLEHPRSIEEVQENLSFECSNCQLMEFLSEMIIKRIVEVFIK